MPIVLDLSGAADADVRFAVSPLVELGWAWHVLVGVDHHPERADWAADTRASLPGDLVADLEAWSFTVRAVRATPLVDPTMTPSRRWEDRLTWLREMPDEEFAEAMLRPLLRVRGRSADLADARVRGRVIGLARARGPAARRIVESILDDPESARDGLVDLLARCRASFFDAEWNSVLAGLSREVEVRSRLYARHGRARALADLSPTAHVDASRLVIDKVRNKRLRVAGRGLVLVPTVFGAGHLYVADEPGRPIVVHYPIPAPSRAADSRATLRRLTVLAHPARLEICRAVAVEPRSAREIARLWGFTESAVTKHLRVLRSAGLVRAERAGHFVRYVLNDAVIAEAGTDLLDVLRR